MRARFLLGLSLSAAAVACTASFSSNGTTDTADQALAQCTAGARPTSGYAVVPALGDKQFSVPVFMSPIPGDRTHFLVVEKRGYLRRAGEDGVVTLALDIASRVNAQPNEAGFLGLALHPKFRENGLAYLSYTKTSSTSPANLRSVLARIKSNDGGITFDPSSITELLQFDQPYSNHNGGCIAFGADGFLYASFGDGGSGGDPQGNGQKLNTFLGKMLRIDIDGGSPYAIPADNPFQDGTSKPEIYAYGLRNTWRFSFDKLTGDLWAGDVGQNKYEEIDRIVKGGNYGWGTREGFHCYGSATCNVANAIDPVMEYGRSEGISTTGGYVYRGSQLPELVGKYLYSDYGSGKVWAIPSTLPVPAPGVYAAGPSVTPEVVVSTGLNVASFAQDNDGELYVIDISGGKVKKLVRTFASEGIPQKLSQTGCFQASDPKLPTDRLIPYDVNSPLWSDGAEKARWMALPPGGKITVGADGDFDFPAGTVLVKEFRLGGKRIETRLFMRHKDSTWAGYTYEWNDQETEATLLEGGKVKPIAGQPWTYPSRSQCMSCHNNAAGSTLGLEVGQLNSDLAYPDGTTANQLTKLESLGLFAAPLAAERPSIPSPTSTTASAEEKAKAYLHANCAFCHRPQGPGRGAADFRYSRTFKGARICNTDPETGDLGIPGAKLMVPGNPASSLISVRMHATNGDRMPPLASAVVDPTGTRVVDGWIASVETCP